MGISDFLDMVNAQHRAEEEHWDRELQRTAWLASLLMNATGNYKKQIKPESLYTSPFESMSDRSAGKRVDNLYVEDEQEKLKELFGLEV